MLFVVVFILWFLLISVVPVCKHSGMPEVTCRRNNRGFCVLRFLGAWCNGLWSITFTSFCAMLIVMLFRLIE